MRTIPIIKGQTIKLHISSINAHGQGVGKVDGYVVFVSEALPGEDCLVKIVSIQSKYAIARVEQRFNSSKLRTNPRCKHFNICGGCQLQHMKYQAQLLLKQKNTMDALKKIGNKNPNVLPVIGMKMPWHYRNKVTFNIGRIKDKSIIGFYELRSHNIVDIDHCYIINRDLNSILDPVRAHLKYLNAIDNTAPLAFYKVFARIGVDNQIMAGTISEAPVHLQSESLVVNLRRTHNDIVSIFHNITPKNSGNLSNENTFLWGKHYIDGRIGNLHFEISPNSFFQVNTEQTVKLYEIIKEFCALTSDDILLDAYCGVGTIGMHMGRNAKKIIGIESVSESINNAKKNAKVNNIRNIDFYAGDCEKVLPQLLSSNIIPTVIIIDPPRKGCSDEFIKIMCKGAPEKIIYVSCNPATMSRDIKAICKKGYQIDVVQPVDMFPHTIHVECVVRLCRKE